MVQDRQVFSERVLRDLTSAVLVLDTHGNIAYVNEPAACMLELENGFQDGEKHFQMITENDSNDRFEEVIFDALYQKGGTTYERVPYTAPSGKKYVFFMSCSFLSEADGESLIVITLRDETLQEEMKRKYNDSSMTFTVFLLGFSGWILICALWEFLHRPIPESVMTCGVELLGMIMFVFVLRHTSLSWSDLGITTNEPGKTVKTGLIIAAGSVAFLCALKAIIRIFAPNSFGPGEPFFDIRLFGPQQLRYIFTAGIQEFLARSVMQGNLKRIAVGKYPGALAIVLSSFIFAGLHVYLGFLFMIGAAILAGLEGILYERQQNIFGVWIVHWVFGVAGTLLRLIDH